MNTRTDTSQDFPFIPAPRITTVAGYLLTRLAEAGVRSVFGVSGDDNLPVLDAIAGRADLAWIGMATEQGAGYAADSYARLRGLGALVTTFGVGELSAINAVAGAYAGSVPVVHIVGTPALEARQTGSTLRDDLPGCDHSHFARMAAEVTAAQADLRPDTAPEEIDRVLTAALRRSRPVYLNIPADVAAIPVLAPAGPLPRATGDADTVTSGTAPKLPATKAPTRAFGDDQLIQADVRASLQHFLRPGDLVIIDRGIAFYGAAELALPDGADLAGPPLWAPLGWAVPAALGASLAAPDRRVVLIVGDGAIQQAAAELGTLLGQGLVPVVIVLGDGGYTTERLIGHPDAGYHDIPAWDWTALPLAVAPPRGVATLRAATRAELARALAAADRHTSAGRPVLIEAVPAAADAPPLLQDLSRVLADR